MNKLNKQKQLIPKITLKSFSTNKIIKKFIHSKYHT